MSIKPIILVQEDEEEFEEFEKLMKECLDIDISKCNGRE